MRTLIIFIFLLLSLNSSAQYETSKWYFGNKSALDFDKGKLNVLSDSEMDAPAGSASISNDEGVLMFYSDGATVWNRNHEIMTNGEDLAGDIENFQSAIIIPKPGDDETYYLVYSRTEPSSDPLVTAGTFFSEIKFTNEDPLGIVSQKNNFLGEGSPSEKLTAVHHKSGESFWLVTLTASASDPDLPKTIFKAYHITDQGFNTSSVKTNSEVDIVHFGSMKLSVDGSKLFVTSKSTDDRKRYVHYFKFNNENGEITFERNILIDPPGTNWPPKGIEISPNGKFIYVSFIAGNANGIIQYEIGDISIGQDPRAMITFRNNIIIESLQLANDQKIYVALSQKDGDGTHLGVINFPNEKGLLTDYFSTAVELTPGGSKKGLPNFIQSYFASKIVTEDKCFVEEFSFTSESYAPISNAIWDFGDGNTGIGINTTHTYNAPGEYIVKGVLTVGSKKVTVFKVVNAFALPVLIPNQELTECDTDFDGLSTFNLNSIRSKITNPDLNEELFFYLSLDDLNNDIQISDPENFQNTEINQEIFVKAINENGCSETTSFRVNSRFIQLETIPDFFSCENTDGISGDNRAQFNTSELEIFIRNQISIPNATTITFHPSLLEAQTNLNQFDDNFFVPSSTVFIKVQEQDLSCGGIQSINLIVNSEPKINLEDEYTICFVPSSKPPVIVSADTTNDLFEWKDSSGTIISTNQEFVLESVGEFSLTVYKNENGITCTNSKEFTVVNPDKPVFLDINVNTEDETNNIVSISITGNSSYEYSLDNITFFGSGLNHTFSNVDAGLRTVFVRDVNNCEQPIQTNVSVIGFKKFFTPNGDGENDFWNVSGIDPTSFKSIDVRIFDRYGIVIGAILDFNTLGWDGTYNGKQLISNNYWFKANIVDKDDNIIKKSGNFSLIRE
jgi:gliding motility-associated-like protein